MQSNQKPTLKIKYKYIKFSASVLSEIFIEIEILYPFQFVLMPLRKAWIYLSLSSAMS